MLRISKYVLYDIMRNRIVVLYGLFLFLLSMGLYQLEENNSKAMLGLLNIVLIVIPLVSLVFTTIHWYNSYEFIELLLTQPVSRKKVLVNEFIGASSSLITAVLAGIGIPTLLYNFNATGCAIILIGCLLTLVFTSLAFAASVKSRDKARGIGVALLLWFYFTLIFDGLMLLLIFTFSDYPLEKFILFLSALNPVDLGRIFIMLQMDISALMGYTGAIYRDFLGSGAGLVFTVGVMIIWIAVPLLLAIRFFNRKDL